MAQPKLPKRPRSIAIVIALCISTVAGAQDAIENPADDLRSSPTEMRTKKSGLSDAESLRRRSVSKALDYLSQKGQDSEGTFSLRVGPGVTALVIAAEQRNGKTIDDPVVSKAARALEGFVKPDGGIYGNGRLKNYETCVSMMALSLANSDGRYTRILQNAQAFVKGLQYGDGSRPATDPWYGGASYDGKSRPDLSNTTYLIEALRATECGPDDPAIQAALKFVSRSQNLKTEFNDSPFADKVNDGGFFYVQDADKAVESESEEPTGPEGGLRSYGSMTYAGLKSMVYAGLTREDERVKAAVQWIGKNYDLASNPGMGSAGLYYYYHTFATGLNIAGVDAIVDADGRTHDWRADLINELARRQNPDGSWSNTNSRWFEQDKNLATAFALIALAHAAPVQSDESR